MEYPSVVNDLIISCHHILQLKSTCMIVSLPSRRYITKTCPCNIQRFFSVAKNENFVRKFLIFFLSFAQNIDRRGGSNEYPQSMFRSKNKKNRFTPAYPSFAMKKWCLRGYTLHGHVFLMELTYNYSSSANMPK